MYIVVYFIGILSSFTKSKRKVLLTLFAFCLFLLAVFRYGVGPDYFSYKYLFNRLNISIMEEIKHGVDNQEILFRIVGSSFKKIGFSYQLYLAVFAFINLLFVTKTCKQFSKNPVLSLLIYYSFFYFVWTFSGIRQGIVIAIGMYYFLMTLKDDKKKRLILISIVLSFIHSSALLLIPLFYLSKITLRKNTLTIISLISVLISVLPLGSLLQPVLHLPILNRILPYMDYDSSIISLISFKSLARICFLIIGLIFYKHDLHENCFISRVILTYIISLDLYFILRFSELSASRLSIYGFYLIVIIIPEIYSRYNERINRFIVITLTLLLMSMYFYKELDAMKNLSGLIAPNRLIVPYSSVLCDPEIYEFNNYYFD